MLLIGNSGSGKSTSIGNIPELEIEGLDPKTTIVISALGKELPFKGSEKDYTIYSKTGNPKGNMIVTSDPKQVLEWVKYINASRPDITSIVLDDFSSEYMRRIDEKSYEKFNDIGYYMSTIATIVKSFRSDLCVFFLHHSREIGDGILESKQTNAMTIGKLVDDKLSGYESFFTVVLRAVKSVEGEDVKFNFLTKDAYSSVKTPIGMFEDVKIKNDLGFVRKKIDEYYNNK